MLTRRPSLGELADETSNEIGDNPDEVEDWEVKCQATIVGKPAQGEVTFEILGLEVDEDSKVVWLNIAAD